MFVHWPNYFVDREMKICNSIPGFLARVFSDHFSNRWFLNLIILVKIDQFWPVEWNKSVGNWNDHGVGSLMQQHFTHLHRQVSLHIETNVSAQIQNFIHLPDHLQPGQHLPAKKTKTKNQNNSVITGQVETLIRYSTDDKSLPSCVLQTSV